MSDQQQLDRFKAALQMQGEHNEGKDGDRGDTFGSGDTYESFTWPKAVEVIDDDGEGVIRYPYDAMIRDKHYVARQETSTHDTRFSGTVTASYVIGRSGKVYIDEITFEPAQRRRCGNSIVTRLKSLSGQNI